MAKGMTLDDLARRRITSWRKNTPGMTQQALGELIGRTAVWVSRWERGSFDADLDTLAAMARAFGHTLFAALDVRQDEREQQVLDYYRSIQRDKRDAAIDALALMAGIKRKKR